MRRLSASCIHRRVLSALSRWATNPIILPVRPDPQKGKRRSFAGISGADARPVLAPITQCFRVLVVASGPIRNGLGLTGPRIRMTIRGLARGHRDGRAVTGGVVDMGATHVGIARVVGARVGVVAVDEGCLFAGTTDAVEAETRVPFFGSTYRAVVCSDGHTIGLVIADAALALAGVGQRARRPRGFGLHDASAGPAFGVFAEADADGGALSVITALLRVRDLDVAAGVGQISLGIPWLPLGRACRRADHDEEDAGDTRLAQKTMHGGNLIGSGARCNPGQIVGFVCRNVGSYRLT